MTRSIATRKAITAAFIVTTAWLSACPAAPAAEKATKTSAVKSELAALQGTWKWLVFEEGGKEARFRPGNCYVFDGNKLLLKNQDRVLLEGTVSLDPTASPKRLDFHIGPGRADLTIYVLVGDYLIQCGNRNTKTRPTEFTTGTDNGGAYLLILRHEK